MPSSSSRIKKKKRRSIKTDSRRKNHRVVFRGGGGNGQKGFLQFLLSCLCFWNWDWIWKMFKTSKPETLEQDSQYNNNVDYCCYE